MAAQANSYGSAMVSPKSPSLDDFKQVKMLGEGAFAAVYKVIRHADGDEYALKKVKLPSLSEKEKVNALNEIRLLASVQHENIISYKDAFFDDKTRCLCIVTELADRGDLMGEITRCQKGRTHLPEEDIWRFLIGLANALQALHCMTIFHRDLKSANIFLSSSPKGTIAKLGDFNVSAVAKHGLCLTQTGTPYYASPEIWRDIPYDGKSDMWGLGCVMYEAAALKPPFRAEDMEGLCKKVCRGQYKRIPSVYTQELADAIGTMLQVNPRYRPSAGQLLQLPIMRQRALKLNLAETDPGTSNLLSTLKLPRKLIDLSACFPQSQYTERMPTDDKGIDEDHVARGQKDSCKGSEKANQEGFRLPTLIETPQSQVNTGKRHASRRRAFNNQPPQQRRHAAKVKRSQLPNEHEPEPSHCSQVSQPEQRLRLPRIVSSPTLVS